MIRANSGDRSVLPKRRTIRLAGYDYSQNGAYFITVCSQRKRCWFGNIENGEMHLTSPASVVLNCWQSLSKRFPHAQVDAFVIMPNHVHGIIFVGAQFIAPEKVAPSSAPSTAANADMINRAPTLGQIVRAFKAASAFTIRKTLQPLFAWQRNYYEHVIRSEESLNRIRVYIMNNPLQWEFDRENPFAAEIGQFERRSLNGLKPKDEPWRI